VLEGEVNVVEETEHPETLGANLSSIVPVNDEGVLFTPSLTDKEIPYAPARKPVTSTDA
jgi:hypothetical protein